MDYRQLNSFAKGISYIGRSGLDTWTEIPNWLKLLWYRTQSKGFYTLKDPIPAYTFGASKYLENLLSPQMIAFEYGSGGSTLYFAKRLRSIVTVEHDQSWWSAVDTEVKRRLLENCDCLFQPPIDQLDQRDLKYGLDNYLSERKSYKDKSFINYVTAIDSFPENHFDLVLIDGRSRLSCISHALPKIRKGGILVLDNSERIGYQPGIEFLDACGYQKREFCGLGPYSAAPWCTTIWNIT